MTHLHTSELLRLATAIYNKASSRKYDDMDTQTIYDSVQEHYSTIAKRSEQDNTERIAKHFGYDAEDMDSIISEANLGLSCGNPLAIASMKPVRSTTHKRESLISS